MLIDSAEALSRLISKFGKICKRRKQEMVAGKIEGMRCNTSEGYEKLRGNKWRRYEGSKGVQIPGFHHFSKGTR